MQNKKIAFILALALFVQCFVVTGLAGAINPELKAVAVQAGGKSVTGTVDAGGHSGTINLKNLPDTDVFESITLTAQGVSKLVIAGARSEKSNITYTPEFEFSSDVLTIPAAAFIPGGVSLSVLRGVFGTSVTVYGTVISGLTSYPVELTLNLSDTPVTASWGTYTKAGTTITATIKSTVLSNPILGSLSLDQIKALAAEAVGKQPTGIATSETGTYHELSNDLTVLKATFKALFAADLHWETATFANLIAKSPVWVKFEDNSVCKLVFKEEAATPPGPGPGPVDPDGGGGGTNEPPVVAKPIETEEGKTVHEVRATAGLIPDIVIAKSKGQTSLTIDVTAALPKDTEVEVLTVQIPKDIVKSLAGLEVVLDTPYGGLTLPKALVEALAAAGEEISLTIQPGKPEAVQAEMSEWDALLTEPVEIITSLKGSTIVTLPCNLPLPAEAKEREAFLASLYVLAIHGEEDVEQIGELTLSIDEETDTLLAISFQVDRFSTFALAAAGTEPEAPKSKLYTAIDAKTYVINEDIRAFDNVTSYRANGETTVMAVRLLQELGAKIGYQRVDNVGVATVIYGDTTATLREKSNIMTVVDAAGERQVTLRTVFTNLNGRTYLPTRDVAENLGFFVHWAAQDDSITITAK